MRIFLWSSESHQNSLHFDIRIKTWLIKTFFDGHSIRQQRRFKVMFKDIVCEPFSVVLSNTEVFLHR